MIDDKKIENTAKVYMIGVFYYKDEAEWIYPITNEEKRNQCIIDFKAGAKWAINEFLKDLWHPASEEPKCHSYIMFKTTNNNGFGTEYIDCSWKTLARCLQITQWIYIDDLFPKKGGENEGT